MKRVFLNRIGLFGCWMAGTLLASATILPVATADNNDDGVVEDISKAKVGENLSATCDTTTSNLDKRGKLVYDKDTGSLKFDVSTDKGD